MTRVRINVQSEGDLHMNEVEVCRGVVRELWQVVFSSTRPASMKYAYAFRGTIRYEFCGCFPKSILLIGAPPLADDSHYLMKGVRERLWARGETPQSGWVWCEELET